MDGMSGKPVTTEANRNRMETIRHVGCCMSQNDGYVLRTSGILQDALYACVLVRVRANARVRVRVKVSLAQASSRWHGCIV